MLLKLDTEKENKFCNILNRINLINILNDIKKINNINFFFVGGLVRDYFLNRNTNDIDIITTESKKLTLLLAKYYKVGFIVLDEELEIFRIVLKKYNIIIDIAKIRYNNLKKDILERDFTINSLVLYYKNNNFYLLDLVDGLKHLQQKKIVLSSEKSLVLDPLRIMRAFRFSASLDFLIDSDTIKSIRENILLIKNIASERLFYELSLYINSNNILKNFDLFINVNLLPYFCGGKSNIPVVYNDKIREIIDFLQNEKDIEGFFLSEIKLKDVYFTSPYHFLILFVLFCIIYNSIFDLLIKEINISSYIKSNLKILHNNYKVFNSITSYNELEDVFLELLIKKGDMAIILLFYILLEGKFYNKELVNIKQLFDNFRKIFYKNYKKEKLIDGKFLIEKGLSPSPIFAKILLEIEKKRIKGIIKNLHDVESFLRNKIL